MPGPWALRVRLFWVTQEMTLAGLTEGFLFGIIWRSLFFWVPIFGKLLALGHLWFLWNLFQYSVILIPVFHLVGK
ncbi:MAG: hypothetical protein Ct9H90mP23_0830 [Methanobacteriota archaeon]|nr:MAG: hypothetical protein Ct9H90mP23_0830 [Euryarchaeota archaeon]